MGLPGCRPAPRKRYYTGNGASTAGYSALFGLNRRFRADRRTGVLLCTGYPQLVMLFFTS